MKWLLGLVALILGLHGSVGAQIRMIAPSSFNSTLPILDFDTNGAPWPGLISGSDPYFQTAGIANASIINDPGLHQPGDSLQFSSNASCLAAQNNQLAIVSPFAPMDNHQAGAGWSFQLAAPMRQVTFEITDELGHDFLIETWNGGVMQNSLILHHPWENPAVWYLEDAVGFDEIRFKSPQTNSGWGIDNLGFGDPCPNGVCPPFPFGKWQRNSAEASADIDGRTSYGTGPIKVTSIIGEASQINVDGLANPYEVLIQLNGPGPVSDLGLLGAESINLDPFDPSSSFLFGLSFSSMPLSPMTLTALAPNGHLDFQMAVLDPAAIQGVRLSAANSLEGISCQYSEDFENLPTGQNGGSYPPGWSNGGGSQEWNVQAGPTHSNQTGPLGAMSGIQYLYCETSPVWLGWETYIFNTCAYDTASLSSQLLSFGLSRDGSTIGTLEIFQDDGAGFGATPIATYTGSNGAAWTGEAIPLTLSGPTVRFRFKYTSGLSWTGDLAIDLVQLL